MELAGVVTIASLFFFLAMGTWVATTVSLSVFADLDIPWPKMTLRRCFKVVSVTPLLPLVGVAALFDSKWAGAGLRFSLVVAMCGQGAISEDQAKSYLLTHDIRWTP